MQTPVTLRHGSYTIKAGTLAGKAVARAFVTGGKPGVIAEKTGDDVDAAVASLKADLDARAADEAAHRRRDAELAFDVPTEAEFARALAIVKPHDGHWRMLRAHALAGDRGLTAGEIAFDAGYHGHGAANLQLGLVGREIAEALRIDLPKFHRRDGDASIGVLATPAPPRDGQPVWVMHPELRMAVLAHTP